MRLFKRGTTNMKFRMYASLALIATVILASGCANTIRGAGRDVANTVDATQNAGNSIDNAAQ
jgi:predicted small secreted protein